MKRLLVCVAIFLFGAWLGYSQSTTSQIGSVVASTHASCTVSPSTTQLCFATDGLWLSVNGAAYVQVQTGTVVAGVTSITINSGTKQTGDVVINVPSKVTVTSQTTSTGVLQ